ncbi:MAG TPA: glycosyl hydrolase family 8 [Bosea sp. (in: a-proteobacteria)]|uniref:glycosyl hydrolase family 8 n=1 Tax=Bosea sp. (in: a-proteobacteria) TaxID=1871050 RepID=UPI002E138512|nr:glycosyl hydrolase family 8 [Bosea sp. (in: a-proteobacteria)]
MNKLIATMAAALMTLTCSAQAALPEGAWELYRQKFVTPEGRVIDDVNGGISHSESQGYGLLLACLAGDRASFARILGFTRTELLIRDDGLAAWRWDPKASPRVTDINNASDGDLLIAEALACAGSRWNMPAYTTAARQIARALAKVALLKRGGETWLMPAAAGFTEKDRPDGPVVNPSYWVFEALPAMAQLTGDQSWMHVQATGLRLLDTLAKAKMPAPEWLSVKGIPQPADGFPAQFGYNAIRIPLYLMRAGLADKARMEPFRQAWAGGPAVIDVKTGKPVEPLPDPGYRMLAAAMACVLDKTAIPADLKTFQPTGYYPSTLHLLSLSMLRERYPQCL